MTHDLHDLQRNTQLSEMTGEEVTELFRLFQQGQHSGRLGVAASAGNMTDELALKLTMLEAELRGLRQVLTEVKANPDGPRQEMDELRRVRRLADRKAPTPTGVQRRVWFCGRAAGN